CVQGAGAVAHLFMPKIMGGGAALFDFDNDGRLDIYLLQSGGPDSRSTNRLYRQGPDGRFTDVSKGSGLDIAGYCTGVAIGDVNNDGLPDVLVTFYGGIKLFLNQGAGKFMDITVSAGFETSRWATSVAFVDYDPDCPLDLVVAHYVEFDSSRPCHGNGGMRDYCHPSYFTPCATRLYHNTSPAAGKDPLRVRFEDVTEKAGLGRRPGPGLGILCADFDGDG